MKTKLRFFDSNMIEVACEIAENDHEANEVKKKFVLDLIEKGHKEVTLKAVSVDKTGLVDKTTRTYEKDSVYHDYLLSVFNKSDQ